MTIIMGIDIGGTGIKGAPVDTKAGTLAVERFRILTPQPATPEAVAKAVGEVVAHFSWTGPVGCGFPAGLNARGQFSFPPAVGKVAVPGVPAVPRPANIGDSECSTPYRCPSRGVPPYRDSQ